MYRVVLEFPSSHTHTQTTHGRVHQIKALTLIYVAPIKPCGSSMGKEKN